MRSDRRRCFIPIIDSLLGSTTMRPRDRSNRLLDYRAMPAPKLPLNSADELTSEDCAAQRLNRLSCGQRLNGGCSILRRGQ